jgi:glycerol-3-phosphate acyltransferase PlsY
MESLSQHAAIYVTLWLIAGFLVGSIPFGWFVAKLGGVNIRDHGSGNIGMTNVWRVLGWKAGVTVLILDLLKGFVPVWAAALWGIAYVHADNPPNHIIHWYPRWLYWMLMGVGLAAVLGHTFTPWLRFKGGKGVATGLGVIIALMQQWVLIPVVVFAITLAITRYVSLGSILGSLAVAATCLAVHTLRQYTAFALLVPLVILFTHRSNIKRLLAGTENKVGRRPAQDAPSP